MLTFPEMHTCIMQEQTIPRHRNHLRNVGNSLTQSWAQVQASLLLALWHLSLNWWLVILSGLTSIFWKDFLFMKKKRVTAGEVDTWGKELGNCTHQWTTNDEKNKQARSTLSVFFFCLSFFFNLKKTLSVESACLFFSSFVVHWLVHFPSSFPHLIS